MIFFIGHFSDMKMIALLPRYIFSGYQMIFFMQQVKASWNLETNTKLKISIFLTGYFNSQLFQCMQTRMISFIIADYNFFTQKVIRHFV